MSKGAKISTVLSSSVLNKYISGGNYEIFVRKLIDGDNIYSVFVNKIGNRFIYTYTLSRASALTVIKAANKHGIIIIKGKNELK